MNILEFSQVQFQLFLLLLARVAGIFTLAPFFGSQTTPVQFRVGAALFISLLFLPLLPASFVQPPNLLAFFLMVARETMMGLLIGAMVLLMFVGVQLAGQFIDIQIGFGIVNIVDPQSGGQITLIGQVYFLFALLLFLVLDLHHVVIAALYKSFQIVPVGTPAFPGSLLSFVDDQVSRLFVVAFQLSAAPIAVLFLAEVAMGFIARTVPQMNIFIVGFPLRIAMGLFFLFLLMPLAAVLMKQEFGSFLRSLHDLFFLLRAGLNA